MEPIRVLNVVGRMDRGGIETFIMNIYRNIDRSLVQFDFLAHYGKPDADYNSEIRSLGGRIYEMPAIKTTTQTRYWRYFEYRRALKDFFSQHSEYHVLHGHMTNTAAIYMPIARKFGSVRCAIAHSHLTEARHGMTGIVTDLLRPALLGYATDYFACSEKAARWLFSDTDIARGKVTIVPNAIDSRTFVYDPEQRRMARSALGIDGQLVIGHVGRFYPQKNHDFLIRMFRELQALHRQSVLLLVGEGVLIERMRALVLELGIADKVIFTGVRSDIPELLQAMDAFVLPSHFEGLPVVGIEAQASGLPCFMSDTITNEVAVTDAVSFLSLTEGASAWAQTVLDGSLQFVRQDTRHQILDAGYDAQKVAKSLQNLYLEKHG